MNEHTDTFKTNVKHYIEKELVADQTLRLKDDDDLLIGDTLDSLGVMRLVEYIEKLLDIRIPPEDITIDNFQSVGKIHEYVSHKFARL